MMITPLEGDLRSGPAVRRGWAARLLENLIEDLRFGLRQLWKTPSFTGVATLTLALGIGANTAIFTLVHAVMLTSLPVNSPEQLYSLGDHQICCDTGRVQESFTLYSYPLYKERIEHLPGFAEVTAFQSGPAGLSVSRSSDPGLAEPFYGEIVSGNYFSTLGVGAFAGRTLTSEDDRPNAQPVAVLSYRAWNSHYARDPSVIGGSFIINGQPMTVVGIAPPGFFGETLRSDPPAFWLPLALEPVVNRDNSLLNRRDVYWLYAIGRVQPGVAVGQVQESLKIEVQHWLTGQFGNSEQNRRQISKMRLVLTPAGSGISKLRDKYSSGLRLLMIVSAQLIDLKTLR